MMRTAGCAVALLLLCCGVSGQDATGKAHPYTVLYVFGDSYSDSGAGYVDTNGPTAVVYMAQRLGVPFTYYGDPASAGKGLNFAVSGAQSGSGAGRRFPTGEMTSYGMKNQVEDFVQFSKLGFIPKIDAEKTMFYFAGGLNDRTKPEGFTRDNIEAEIETLYGLGARRFMVAVMPVKIPQFTAAGTRANPELAQVPPDERAKHADIRIAMSEWGAFFDEVISHPAKYGITDTTNVCAGRTIRHESTVPCASPETHFFYHEGHPSTAAHKAVGEMLAEEARTAP